MVVEEVLGHEPARATVEGGEVWLRRAVEEFEADLGDGRTAAQWRCETVHFAGDVSAADAERDFDALWDAHAHDGEDPAAALASLRSYCADLESALLEIGDMVGGGE